MAYPQLPMGVTPQQFYRRSRRVGMRGLGAMGTVIPFAGSVQPQINQIAQQLQQTAAQIQANNQLLIQGVQAGLDMKEAGAQNMQAQNTNEQAISEFTSIYRAVYGSVPPGLSGMGQFDPATLATYAGVAAALTIVAGLAYTAYTFAQAANTKAQAALTQAQTGQTAETNSTSLAQQAAAAYAAGNQALGDQLSTLAAQQAGVAQSSVAPPPPPPPSALDFFTQNWPWLAGGVVGIWALSKL